MAKFKLSAIICTGFIIISCLFFLLLGKPPLKMLGMIFEYSFGDSYSISQTFTKTAPILICALAAAVPGRLGLISVGAEGQLHAGAIFGTAIVISYPNLNGLIMLPMMLIMAAIGGGLYGLFPGLLRARLNINETISTLLLNYVAVLILNSLVYGAWRDPNSQGWPATISFTDGAQMPTFFNSIFHLGLLLGIGASIILFYFFYYSRWSKPIQILADNRKVGENFGLNFNKWVLILMFLGGALAGIAGIVEASAIQGRLQPSLSAGYGLTGFLVAWLSRHQPLVIVPVSLFVGALVAGSDALQMFAKVPASSAIILQSLLFAMALSTPGLLAMWRKRYV